jgi:hypothetical protein
MSKILAVLEIIQSKPDIYGNTYTAMVVTNTETGKIASGKISGGSSNCEYALLEMTGGEWGNFTTSKVEIGIREWNRRFNHAEYLGCTPDQINPNILKQWNK